MVFDDIVRKEFRIPSYLKGSVEPIELSFMKVTIGHSAYLFQKIPNLEESIKKVDLKVLARALSLQLTEDSIDALKERVIVTTKDIDSGEKIEIMKKIEEKLGLLIGGLSSMKDIVNLCNAVFDIASYAQKEEVKMSESEKKSGK